MSIWEVKSAVEKVLISEIDMNLEILKSQAKKELSYDEARKIAKEIYNVDMGKDISGEDVMAEYIGIALIRKKGIPLFRELLEKAINAGNYNLW